jgi:hypothetical protein
MSNDKTSGFYNEDNQNVVWRAIGKTSGSASGIEPYMVVLPSNINVFSSVSEKVADLEDKVVSEQVNQTLLCLYLSLQKANKWRGLNNYLSRLNLVQQEDKAALLEWNFQDFRVGFALEPEKSESSYYIVSQDKEMGFLETEMQKFDADISCSVDKIVEYVLENT